MPISDNFQRVPCSQIVVDRDARQRRVIDTKGLKESIASIGVLKPIIVDRQFKLQAGERRLTASIELGLPDIIIRFADELSPTESLIIELEENIKRAPLEWEDQVQAISRIHKAYSSLDPDWTMGETADAISLDLSTVSMYLKVAKEMGDERIAKAGTVREAYNIIGRRESRQAGDALQELLEITVEDQAQEVATPGEIKIDEITGEVKILPAPPRPKPAISPPQEEILNTSFLSWAPQHTGRKFSLVHCDFPYGVNFASGPQAQGSEPDEIYDDSPEVYWELVDCLGTHLNKFMSLSGHLMFWTSADHRIISSTIERLEKLAPSLEFWKFPLIWHKSDNAGIASDARRTPRHIYETCLLASRGRRQIVKIVSDFYSAPTDKRFHISTKPEAMLRHFMSMLTDENTTLLDPTCGSASSLRAAESLGAKQILGLEINEQYAQTARKALRDERLKRIAAKALI